MNKLNDLSFPSGGANRYDFAHVSIDWLNDIYANLDNVLIAANADVQVLNDDNRSKIYNNVTAIEEYLNNASKIYNIRQAAITSESLILYKKLARIERFNKIVCNFTLELIQTLYYYNIRTFEKSGLTLTQCVERALKLVKPMSTTLMKELEDEFNLANIQQAEFGKNGKNKK